MPTSSKNGKRSRGRTGKPWELARGRILNANRICAFRGNDKYPPCGQFIDPDLKWPDPMSGSVNHKTPVSDMAWDDPRTYDLENLEPMHLICNQRAGTGKQKKFKHPTSRNWRE